MHTSTLKVYTVPKDISTCSKGYCPSDRFGSFFSESVGIPEPQTPHIFIDINISLGT